jgi:plastocyanin
MSLLARFGVLLVAMGAVFMVMSAPAHAATFQVNITDDLFCGTSQPCTTNFTAGDTVHWVWMGIHQHSTTSDAGSGQVWDSGQHGNGFTFDQTFNTPGSYSYHCTVHATMHGTIVVAAVSVGGIAQLPAVAPSAATGPASSDSMNAGLMAGVAALAIGLVALSGAAWYARRRRAL